MQHIEKELTDQKPIKKIDLETVFANVYGRTLFSLFFEFSEVAGVIYKMLSDMNLDVFFDEKHV
jgi:hypothetical protein